MRVDFDAFRYLADRRFWTDLAREVHEDNCWGMAAQLSYYFLLAFFPFVIFLSALIGFIPLNPGLLNRILAELNLFLPERTYTLVRAIALQLVNAEDAGVLSIGILLALWFASLGFTGMVGLLNRAYDVEETRPYYKVLGICVGVTILVSLFVILSSVLLFFGDALIEFAFKHIHLAPFEGPIRGLYWLVRWVLIFLFFNVGIQIVYFALPTRRLPWKTISAGSALATLGWIFGSRGFALYVNHYANYQKFYGSLSALVVLMIWFYISSFVLLVGGEIDSEIYLIRQGERHLPETARKK